MDDTVVQDSEKISFELGTAVTVQKTICPKQLILKIKQIILQETHNLFGFSFVSLFGLGFFTFFSFFFLKRKDLKVLMTIVVRIF